MQHLSAKLLFMLTFTFSFPFIPQKQAFMNEFTFMFALSQLELDCAEQSVHVTGASEDTYFYHTLSPSSVQSVNMLIKL